MSEQEYVVSLNRDVDYDAFNTEMVATTGAGDIPNREVVIADPRLGSYRNTHYMLTDAEATALRSDSRVYAVELKPELRDDIELLPSATQISNFTKTTSDTGTFVNWGLTRLNEQDNNYEGTNGSASTTASNFDFTLTGTGVDVVIMDSGIYATHPEFLFTNGDQRIERINWYSSAGVSGTQPSGFYNDYSGHGTHCAGIAAGLNYGWAKDAKIFSMKVGGLEGPNDPSVGIPISTAFDLIKLWHRNKTAEAGTGYKRPTVVNMSFQYSSRYSGITGGSYRGATWTGTSRDLNKGMTGYFDGSGFRHPVRVASVDTDVQEMIDEGIHVVIAAGNNFTKVDEYGGTDYDNYYTSSTYGSNRTYHQGGSPYDDQAFIVGNVDSVVSVSQGEQKAQSSNSGPGVDLFAPGTNIMSAASIVSDIGGTADYEQGEGSSFFQQANISGTSMAAPQVAGMISLYAGLNPSATPTQVKAWFMSNAQDDKLFTTGLDNDYSNSRSLWNGPNKFAWNQYNANKLIQGQFPTDPTFTLSKDILEVDEDGSFTITLTTLQIAEGTVVPYTITGVQSADINNAALTGSFTMDANGVASVTYTVTADLTTEGSESFILTLDNSEAEIGLELNDTSTNAQRPVYNLTRTAASITEGQSVTFNLETSNVSDGDIGYTITGINNSDLSAGSLTGNITLTNGVGAITITTAIDQSTEGTETLTFSLNDPFANPVTVDILDTSLTPTYALETSSANIDEGFGVTISLTTTDLFDGTNVPYEIEGISSSDINEALSGNFVVVNNSASIDITTNRDLTTEGSEIITITLPGKSVLVDVNLADASPARPAGNTFAIFISDNTDDSFEIAGQDRTSGIFGNNIDININYGDTIQFTVSSAGHPIYIKDTPGSGTTNLVGDTTNQGATTGQLIFTPNARGTFYYQCSVHGTANGSIIVS